MMNTIHQVPLLDSAAGEQAKRHIDQLTKPPGSLGRLEELAVELALMSGNPFPEVSPPGVIVFAGDHGISEEGVSAFPREVTAQMVMNFLNGGAAINVFSRQIGALMQIVDVGVAADLPAVGMISKKVRNGTGNFLLQDAMSREEAEQCIQAGIECANEMIGDGAKLLIIGEMGIGNTTASSAMLAVMTGEPVDSIVGKGTGINEERLGHKKEVIRKALEARKPNAQDPVGLLAKVGGLEIGAMSGAILCGASARIPILVDGFISTVAALLAVKLNPRVRDYLIVSHHSQEPGHSCALQALNKKPLLDLQMRLGEGSGAAIAFPIVESAARMMREMATFSSAGVSQKC